MYERPSARYLRYRLSGALGIPIHRPLPPASIASSAPAMACSFTEASTMPEPPVSRMSVAAHGVAQLRRRDLGGSSRRSARKWR